MTWKQRIVNDAPALPSPWNLAASNDGSDVVSRPFNLNAQISTSIDRILSSDLHYDRCAKHSRQSIQWMLSTQFELRDLRCEEASAKPMDGQHEETRFHDVCSSRDADFEALLKAASWWNVLRFPFQVLNLLNGQDQIPNTFDASSYPQRGQARTRPIDLRPQSLL